MDAVTAERAGTTGEVPHDRRVAAGDAGLLATMSTMRAMRRLSPDPVPDEILTGLIEAATWAPSGQNAQAELFILVTDRMLMAELAPVWGDAVNTYLSMVAAVSPAPRDDAWRRIREAIVYQRDHFAETPALIVACHDNRETRSARRDVATNWRVLRALGPRRTIRLGRAFGRFSNRSTAASVYPAVENLLLAARAAGLGACLTTWHLLVEADVKRILGVPDGVDTYALIPVGWPLGTFGPVKRRPVTTFIRRDRWHPG